MASIVRNQVAALTGGALSELEVAHLRTCVAIELIPLIDDMIEDGDSDGRLALVGDVVDCWLRLPQHIRDSYDKELRYGGLSRFVGDYIDVIEAGGFQDPDDLTEDEAEERCRRKWQQHQADVQRRQLAGEPPSDVWLQRITVEQTRP